MRAVALHPDVIVVTSALLQVNCVIVRGGGEGSEQQGEGTRAAETFVIDSPVLPDELDALPAVVEQAGFPTPSGLLATHGDWDHLLGRLTYPGLALGCAETTAERLRAAPGEAQRELRAFDDELLIERSRPLALGAVQALPVPGRCEIGEHELQLHPASGHTPDGMAVLIGWTGTLVAGDYLSPIELPTLSDGGDPRAYLATLEMLRGLVAQAHSVVPGHGPILDADSARSMFDEDTAYVQGLIREGSSVPLPSRRRGAAQQRAHRRNVAALS